MTRRLGGPPLLGFSDFFGAGFDDVGAGFDDVGSGYDDVGHFNDVGGGFDDVGAGFDDVGHFNDIGSGYDDVGAAKKPNPASAKTAPQNEDPGGGVPDPSTARPHPPIQKTTVVANHAKVLAKGKDVATHVATTLGKVMLQLSKQPAAVALPRGKVAVGHQILIGAAAAAAMSPQAKSAIAKYNASAAKVAASRKQLAQHALKLKSSVGALAKSMVAQKNAAHKLRQPKSPAAAHVGAVLSHPVIGELLNDPEIGLEAAEIVGDYLAAVGVDANGLSPGMQGYNPATENGLPYASPTATQYSTAPGAAAAQYPVDPSNPPDPSNPGLLMDGSTDPNYGATSSLANMADDPADNPATWPAPPDPSVFIPDMTAAAGIAYDGAKGTPAGYCLSWGLATRSTDLHAMAGGAQLRGAAGIDPINHYGYVWGQYHDTGPEKGVKFGDFANKTGWNKIWGRYHDGYGKWHSVVQASEAYASNTVNNPIGKTLGPLIGNPALPDFAGMRVDQNGNMFWLPQEAPAWLTFPLQQAAAATQQAAQQAAAAADQAAQAALTTQQNQEVLSQDAANAQAAVAAAAQQTQQGQAESDAQTALVQQQQADTQQQQQDMAQGKQAGDLLVQQAQQQLAYNQAHPDQAYGGMGVGPDANGIMPGQPGYDPTSDPTSAMYQGGAQSGGGDDGSGDDGSGDDGSGDDGSGDDDDGSMDDSLDR